MRSNYDRYCCGILYLGKEAIQLKFQEQKTDDDMMVLLDKNGMENIKKIVDVLKGEE